MNVPQVSGNELNISVLVGRAQLSPERIECRALFERRAAVEVTEEALLSTRTSNHQGTTLTSNISPPSWIVIFFQSLQVIGVFQTFQNGRPQSEFVYLAGLVCDGVCKGNKFVAGGFVSLNHRRYAALIFKLIGINCPHHLEIWQDSGSWFTFSILWYLNMNDSQSFL